MKTTHSFLKRTCLFLALFCWLLPMNLSSQIAIGTGTVTLDYTKTSDPAAPVTNTFVLSNLSTPIASETCIAFGNTDWGGGIVLSQVEWSATIVPGIYEIEFTYGTGSWGVKPLVSVYDGSTKVTDIYSAPSGQTSGAWKGQADFSPAPMDVDLQSLTAGKTYTIRITDEWGGGYGLCVGHISFTRKDGGCANSVTASFAKEGSETGSVPSTINSCEGSSITIPSQGSLVKTGYDFVGWSYNSTTYAPGASFTMPATNVTFTAVWEQHVVPAVTNLQGNVSNDDITLTWENYNKLELTTSNVAIEGFSDGYKSTMSYTINNGVIECEYDIKGEYGYKSVEIRLPRERRHVTSIDMKYIFNDPKCATAGGIIPYMMYDGDEVGHSGNWTSYYSSTLSSGVSEFTDFNLVPTNILWGSGSGAYDDQWLIHKVGVSINPPIASTGTFSIKDIYINTSDGQTLLDEVIVVRKEGSAPTSMSDGTQVYAGLLNTCTDSNLPDGDYYYAVYVRDGDAYSNATVVGPISIGDTKAEANLVLNTNATTIPVGGLFTLTHTTAVGYDGSISYSVAPAGVINFNESTGVITGIQMGGSATITVTASETSNFIGDTKTCTVNVTKNFVGDLSIEEAGDNVTLNWFYNLPISLASEGSSIDNGGSYTSSNYADGVRTIVYNHNGGTAFYGRDFKTPNVPNCKSFSFEYRGENNGTNGRIVPYSWGDNPSSDMVDAPVAITSSWQEAVVTPSYYYSAGSTNIQGSALSEGYYAGRTIGCVAFFPMADNSVSGGTLQLRNAYFQLINTNGLTTAVKLVRKKGSAPANASDGEVVYSSSSTTYNDVATLDAGATYYYRVFAIYNDYTYMSNAVSIDVPAPSLTYYERAVTPGEYGTVCIGYAVEHENISGATMYEIDSWSADGKALTLSELGDSESMVAGRPYIFYATGNLLSLGYDGSAAEASAGSHNGLIGSYSQAEITANDDNYIIYQNQLWLVDVLAYVGANRAYIHKTNASPAPGRRQIRLFVAGTEVATGIEQINGTCPDGKYIKDGQLFIRRDGRTYNAQGIEIK